MLRQKLYSAVLLISCSLIALGNIQVGSKTGTKIFTGIDLILSTASNPIISHNPLFTLPDFNLHPTALQFAKDYVKKNSWGLEKLKKNNPKMR